MLDSLSALLSWVISQMQEHGFHVGKPKRFLARSLAFSEDVKLSQCDLIPLEPVCFSEVSLHVLDEGAGDGGRKVERLAGGHELTRRPAEGQANPQNQGRQRL